LNEIEAMGGIARRSNNRITLRSELNAHESKHSNRLTVRQDIDDADRETDEKFDYRNTLRNEMFGSLVDDGIEDKEKVNYRHTL